MSPKPLPYTRDVLPNGLVVLVYPMGEIQAAGLVLRIHSGLYYEEKASGLAHATEHFLFLGTKNFPSERLVNTRFESLGAAHNATTAERDIEIWIHLPKKNLQKGLALLADIVFGSLIPADSVEKERNVVLQEWRRRHDDPYFRFYQHTREERLSRPDHPYVRDESRDLLESFTRDDVVSFYQQFFQPQQMVLGISGGVDPKEALRLVRPYFSSLPSGTFIPEPVFPDSDYAGRKIISHSEKFSQANMEISFPAFGWRQKPRRDRLAAMMGIRILGGGIVSRLWRTLREERGLVYSVGSHLDLFPWMGLTGIYTTCSVERLNEVMSVIKNETDRFADQGPTEGELSLEKEYRLGRIATGFEGSLGTARYFAGEEFDQEGILLLPEKMKMVESITMADVKKATQGLFDWSRFQVGLMNDFTQISKGKFEETVNKIFS